MPGQAPPEPSKLPVPLDTRPEARCKRDPKLGLAPRCQLLAPGCHLSRGRKTPDRGGRAGRGKPKGDKETTLAGCGVRRSRCRSIRQPHNLLWRPNARLQEGKVPGKIS